MNKETNRGARMSHFFFFLVLKIKSVFPPFLECMQDLVTHFLRIECGEEK